MFILLCNGPRHPSTGLLSPCRPEILPLKSQPPFPPPPACDNHVLPVSPCMTALGISRKWDRPVFVLLSLAYFTPVSSRFTHVVACATLFSTLAAPFYISTARGVQFLHILSITCWLLFLFGFGFLIVAILMGVQWYLVVVLICTFLVTSKVERPSMCSLVICLSLEKYLFKFFCLFKKLGGCFCLLLCYTSRVLYIL